MATYSTWTKMGDALGDALRLVRRSRSRCDALKGFRPGRTIVTCAIVKS